MDGEEKKRNFHTGQRQSEALSFLGLLDRGGDGGASENRPGA